MHESGIMRDLIAHSREAAVANHATKVTEVHVVMTPAADFTEESLVAHFDYFANEDDLLRGAKLVVEHEPVAAVCLACDAEFSATEPEPACAQCGSEAVRLDPEAAMLRLTDVVIDAD